MENQITMTGEEYDRLLERAALANTAAVEAERDAAEVRATAAEAERDRLTAEAAAMREALEPFVRLADKRDERYRRRGGDPDQIADRAPAFERSERELSVGDFRRARAAIATTAGADLLERVRRMERIIRDLVEHAMPVNWRDGEDGSDPEHAAAWRNAQEIVAPDPQP